MDKKKLIDWEWIVGGRRLRCSVAFAALTAVFGFAAGGGFGAFAQEPDGEAITNDVVAAEVLARISEMVQSDDSEDAFTPDGAAGTNNVPQASDAASGKASPGALALPQSNGSSGSSNRFLGSRSSQKGDQRSGRRRSPRSRSESSGSASSSSRENDRAPATALPGSGGGPTNLDYAAFRMIVDRNIFDPNRFPRRAGPSVRQPSRQVDSLTLVGIMSYEKGTFAFFDGTSSEYQKALKEADVIAGYKVTNIVPDAVTLAAGTNEVEMHVGMQLRREEKGPWLLASRSGSYSAIPASTSTNAVAAAAATGSDAAPSAAESDIVKKLMQRRAQE